MLIAYDISSGNKNLIRKVLAHEMGHVLQLSHPISNYIADVTGGYGNFATADCVASVMNQSDITLTVSMQPTIIDKINLKNKWGG